MFDENSSTETGRVKGSIKDRIISFLYRKRFKIKLFKNKLIKKETKVIFIFRKKREINNYRDLKELKKKLIEVDVKSENFDFDKYDYYIVEPIKKKGIDTEELKKLETTKNFINNSKKAITNLNSGIKKFDINFKYPKEHKEDLSSTITDINTNISILKKNLNEIDNIDTKKLDNFKIPNNEEEIKESYEIINYYQGIIDNKEKDIKVVDIISNTQFDKKIGVNVNNDTLTKNKDANITEDNYKKDNYKSFIKNIKIYKTSKNSLDKKSESRKTIKALNKFDGFKIRQLKRNEEKVKKDVDSAKNIIDKMNIEVDKVTKEISEITKTTGYTRMIKSCLRVATGILTLPFSKINLFNISLGSALINKGLKDLRKGLETKSEIKIDYKYEDLSNMIKATKDKTKLTELLIMDSLTEIKSIKQTTYLGENNIKDLNKLEENLNKKLKEIDKLNKKLSKQDERNKIKIKKVKDKKV